MAIRRLLLIFSVLQLAACAHYSARECENFDWKRQGFISATEGETFADSLNHFKKYCTTEYGIKADRKEFEAGYKKGLTKYCRPAMATLYGKQGKVYKGICINNNEKEFLANYTKSYNSYASDEIQRLRAQVASLQGQVSSLQGENSSLRGNMATTCTPTVCPPAPVCPQ